MLRLQYFHMKEYYHCQAELVSFQAELPSLNPFLIPLLPSSFVGRASRGIKSKATAIKCCKELKITAPPNEWRNIPLLPSSSQFFQD